MRDRRSAARAPNRVERSCLRSFAVLFFSRAFRVVDVTHFYSRPASASLRGGRPRLERDGCGVVLLREHLLVRHEVLGRSLHDLRVRDERGWPTILRLARRPPGELPVSQERKPNLRLRGVDVRDGARRLCRLQRLLGVHERIRGVFCVRLELVLEHAERRLGQIRLKTSRSLGVPVARRRRQRRRRRLQPRRHLRRGRLQRERSLAALLEVRLGFEQLLRRRTQLCAGLAQVRLGDVQLLLCRRELRLRLLQLLDGAHQHRHRARRLRHRLARHARDVAGPLVQRLLRAAEQRALLLAEGRDLRLHRRELRVHGVQTGLGRRGKSLQARRGGSRFGLQRRRRLEDALAERPGLRLGEFLERRLLLQRDGEPLDLFLRRRDGLGELRDAQLQRSHSRLGRLQLRLQRFLLAVELRNLLLELEHLRLRLLLRAQSRAALLVRRLHVQLQLLAPLHSLSALRPSLSQLVLGVGVPTAREFELVPDIFRLECVNFGAKRLELFLFLADVLPQRGDVLAQTRGVLLRHDRARLGGRGSRLGLLRRADGDVLPVLGFARAEQRNLQLVHRPSALLAQERDVRLEDRGHLLGVALASERGVALDDGVRERLRRAHQVRRRLRLRRGELGGESLRRRRRLRPKLRGGLTPCRARRGELVAHRGERLLRGLQLERQRVPPRGRVREGRLRLGGAPRRLLRLSHRRSQRLRLHLRLRGFLLDSRERHFGILEVRREGLHGALRVPERRRQQFGLDDARGEGLAGGALPRSRVQVPEVP
mmetsp:Transcript_12308/g.52875  ORF Transcript_12308/g.52875 Transcript_12308/m.52875 type:complete len:769 (-) Transcript_12308:509-2815(-)